MLQQDNDYNVDSNLQNYNTEQILSTINNRRQYDGSNRSEHSAVHHQETQDHCEYEDNSQVENDNQNPVYDENQQLNKSPAVQNNLDDLHAQYMDNTHQNYEGFNQPTYEYKTEYAQDHRQITQIQNLEINQMQYQDNYDVNIQEKLRFLYQGGGQQMNQVGIKPDLAESPKPVETFKEASPQNQMAADRNYYQFHPNPLFQQKSNEPR